MGLSERGHEVSFLIYHNETFFAKQLNQRSIPINLVSASSKLLRFFRLVKYLRKDSFDVVISFLDVPNFIATISKSPFSKQKLILGERSANPFISKSIRSILYRWFYFNSDYVVFNSQVNMRIVQRVAPFLSKSKTRVIYNLVNPNRFNNQISRVKEGFLTMIVISSHDFHKNGLGLVNSFEFMPPAIISKLKVIWLGDVRNVDCFEKLEYLINEKHIKDNFLFLNAQEDISSYMNESDFLGLFSFYEGLPNAVCEAMYCGKVVIAPNISDLPHIIKNRELLFNPHSPAEIAKSIMHVVDMDSVEFAKLGERNRNFAQLNFSKDNIISAYESLF